MRFLFSESFSVAERKLKRILAVIVAAFWISFGALFALNVAERKFVYPLGYKEEIMAAAEKYDLDAALLFSVAKTESGFNALAVSVKGAVGIMQITPSTGRFIAEKQGIAEYDLSDAETNVNFGAYYIRYLKKSFSGIRETAAAYNAGEGTVRKWLDNPKYSEDGVTLKEIPYKETDIYVGKICKSFERYKKLYGNLLDKS